MPNEVTDASDRLRTLRIVGTGDHHMTKLLDADTGEDIGRQLGISRIEYQIGNTEIYPKSRLILELRCPVIVEIVPG